VHIGLVLAYVGPHGRAVVGQEGYISRHRALGYMGGPSWPKRVAFLGTAPGPGCILGVSWLTLGDMGGPSWPKRVAFLGTAPGPGGHV